MAACAFAQSEPGEERVGLHGQFTWIRQLKPSFSAPYTGPNSLQPQREWSFSRTLTADLGLRLWPGAPLVACNLLSAIPGALCAGLYLAMSLPLASVARRLEARWKAPTPRWTMPRRSALRS